MGELDKHTTELDKKMVALDNEIFRQNRVLEMLRPILDGKSRSYTTRTEQRIILADLSLEEIVKLRDILEDHKVPVKFVFSEKYQSPVAVVSTTDLKFDMAQEFAFKGLGPKVDHKTDPFSHNVDLKFIKEQREELQDALRKKRAHMGYELAFENTDKLSGQRLEQADQAARVALGKLPMPRSYQARTGILSKTPMLEYHIDFSHSVGENAEKDAYRLILDTMAKHMPEAKFKGELPAIKMQIPEAKMHAFEELCRELCDKKMMLGDAAPLVSYEDMSAELKKPRDLHTRRAIKPSGKDLYIR